MRRQTDTPAEGIFHSISCQRRANSRNHHLTTPSRLVTTWQPLGAGSIEFRKAAVSFLALQPRNATGFGGRKTPRRARVRSSLTNMFECTGGEKMLSPMESRASEHTKHVLGGNNCRPEENTGQAWHERRRVRASRDLSPQTHLMP